ncbi:NB-ARC domain-containing protein [Kitasatospora sp. MAP5-34]|uniref:NB-ARC domain-containing protein n=1 Tax=Kitasatospora sp. MAP5-34 TaxID=3035102 RepID=UPI00247532D8|nr:NB-ARC domain-containing protein [Kitasatospora sp. MAP5-34]MDH6575801.1 tetratricopeptide (TPR) repeat protein [Kitasatospora sp. MAP5-34]
MPSVSGGNFHGTAVLAESIASLMVQSRETPPTIVPGTPKPRLLPAVAAHFTNRVRELGALTRAWEERADSPAPKVIALTGIGGIGKTSTVLRWLADLVGQFPDGQLFVYLRGGSAASATTPDEALAALLGHLGVHPEHVPPTLERKAELFRTLTAERRILLLLDDALNYAQLHHLLPASPHSLTVVTARRLLPELVRERGAAHVPLAPLDEAASLALLARLAGPERVTGQREDAEVVAASCGGSPLALCTVGSRLAVRSHLTLAAVAAEFAAADATADAEQQGAEDPVRQNLDAAYRELSPDAQRLHRLLALHPGPDCSVPVAAAALGEHPDAAGLLAELAELHLVEETALGRYRQHDQVRAHAARLAAAEEGPARSGAAVRRMISRYLRLAAAADLVVMPLRWRLGPVYRSLAAEPLVQAAASAEQALAFLERERPNLAAAVRAAEEYGFSELVWQLCEALWSLYFMRGHHQEWAETHRLGARAALECGEVSAEARMRNQRGFALVGLGLFGEAEQEYRAAARLDAEAGHVLGRASAIESLGLMMLRQQQYDEAAEAFREAAEVLTGSGDPRALALLAHHLGRAMAGQGHYPAALAQLSAARTALAALPDPYNEARALTSIAEAHLAAGRPAEAREPLTAALAIMTERGAKTQEAYVAELLAAVARAEGDRTAEADRLRRALAVYAETGAPAAVLITERLAELG